LSATIAALHFIDFTVVSPLRSRETQPGQLRHMRSVQDARPSGLELRGQALCVEEVPLLAEHPAEGGELAVGAVMK